MDVFVGFSELKQYPFKPEQNLASLKDISLKNALKGVK